MKISKLVIAVSAVLLLGSCSAKRGSLSYFTDLSETKEGTFPKADYMPEIKPDDELFINVTSTVPEATIQYNNPVAYTAIRSDVTELPKLHLLTYIVSSKGDIDFPVLGRIHVAGLTTEQLADMLVEKISKDVTDPMVTVQLLNFKVNVAGEVRTPGQIAVTGNRMTVLDAITAAGDLTEYGERSNVLVIREENGERTYTHLDLNSSDVLNSPYYYVKQNDYIYVEPNSIRQENSKYNQNNAFKLSVTSTIVSAASVIASLIIALTVK